jgi:serine/threonine protein kinase
MPTPSQLRLLKQAHCYNCNCRGVCVPSDLCQRACRHKAIGSSVRSPCCKRLSAGQAAVFTWLCCQGHQQHAVLPQMCLKVPAAPRVSGCFASAIFNNMPPDMYQHPLYQSSNHVFVCLQHLESVATLGVGTPDYMPPEMVRSQMKNQQQQNHGQQGLPPYDAKLVDAWAMGVLLYLLVTGCYPFEVRDRHRQVIHSLCML